MWNADTAFLLGGAEPWVQISSNKHDMQSEWIRDWFCISDFMKSTFFYIERYLKKLADDQYSSITKGSIYHIKHMYIQPFTTIVDWPEIWCLMEVSSMFYICRYCVFTWDGSFI